MQEEIGVAGIAHVIQLSVPPVFLLSGIGAMLSVMTSRLARVVDRARVLEREVIERARPPEALETAELDALSRRATLSSRAITLCTITALLICAVIAVLFIGSFLELDTSQVVAILFIAAMLAFFWGLLTFLREILLATATVRIGLQQVPTRTGENAAAPRSHKPGA